MSLMIYSIVGAQASCVEGSTAVVSDLLLSILQFIVALKVFSTLTYLAAASGYPLVDGALARLDAMLFGFEWNVEANWVTHQPTFDWILQHAYLAYMIKAAFVFFVR